MWKLLGEELRTELTVCSGLSKSALKNPMTECNVCPVWYCITDEAGWKQKTAVYLDPFCKRYSMLFFYGNTVKYC